MSPPDKSFLPYGRQIIEEDDIAAVVEVLRSDWLTTGPAVLAFEKSLCEVVQAKHAIACSNGTAALHLAALVLNLEPGDKVVVPSITFLATANAVRLAGGEVVFADCDPDSGLMEASQLQAALDRAAASGGNPVKAVFPVHLNGQCADLDAIAAVAKDHNLTIVDDAAHAIGSHYNTASDSRPIGDGRIVALTTFSFHPVKTIAMGEGGAVTTNDDHLAERLRSLRSHGMERAAAKMQNKAMAVDTDGMPNPWYYEMPAIGLNYRVTDIQCALGLSQLKKLGRFVARRRQLADRYVAQLQQFTPCVKPLKRLESCQPAWHVFPVLIDFDALGISRRTVMEALRQRGIGSQVHYIPVHRQPYYQERYGDVSFPGAERYYARALSLPLFAGMEESDVDRVVSALAQVLGTGTADINASSRKSASGGL
ncbi:UDP-4-amino-4,6-dideoxy-N-acetyl-beta-L-altrosamine transaminase [Pelagibius sp.]|uniref:UDP-4-amino-4, 6-dideoxy-N-acetyl-beta-L-altrosamine transaminase n=1 Tax=Pelagibius sp. TaxID=1931238 RepID=UPI003BB02A21